MQMESAMIKTKTKRAGCHEKKRCMAYAVVKEASRYMESISKNPPTFAVVACNAIEPGPSSTTRHEKKVPKKMLLVMVLFSLNVLAESCHAISKPTAIKPMLENVFAGCLINPGCDASQKISPMPPSAPNQPLITAIVKSARETKV